MFSILIKFIRINKIAVFKCEHVFIFMTIFWQLVIYWITNFKNFFLDPGLIFVFSPKFVKICQILSTLRNYTAPVAADLGPHGAQGAQGAQGASGSGVAGP